MCSCNPGIGRQTQGHVFLLFQHWKPDTGECVPVIPALEERNRGIPRAHCLASIAKMMRLCLLFLSNLITYDFTNKDLLIRDWAERPTSSERLRSSWYLPSLPPDQTKITATHKVPPYYFLCISLSVFLTPSLLSMATFCQLAPGSHFGIFVDCVKMCCDWFDRKLKG